MRSEMFTFIVLAAIVGSSQGVQESTTVGNEFHATTTKTVLLMSGQGFDTRAETATVASRIVTVGNKEFQVFTSKLTKREVFRVYIGTPEYGWWRYGIFSEGDFNGDGVPDYCWFGGDDTSIVMFVFLSYGRKYRMLDVYESLKKEWARQFPKAAFLSIDMVSSDDDVEDLYLVRDPHGLALEALIVRGAGGMESHRYPLHVAERGFLFSD